MNNTHHKQTHLETQADQLVRLTRNLTKCCTGKDEQIFGSFGLPVAAGRVLLAIADTEVSSPSELAEQLDLGRSRLTALVDLLVQKGLLLRSESTDDRRVRDLTLSSAGLEIAQRVQEYHLSFHKALLQHYHADERDRLLSVLQDFFMVIQESRGKLELSNQITV
jgi:DNA-binding MarR family transcriptional regulator